MWCYYFTNQWIQATRPRSNYSFSQLYHYDVLPLLQWLHSVIDETQFEHLQRGCFVFCIMHFKRTCGVWKDPQCNKKRTRNGKRTTQVSSMGWVPPFHRCSAITWLVCEFKGVCTFKRTKDRYPLSRTWSLIEINVIKDNPDNTCTTYDPSFSIYLGNL